jgi:hypothetical protein
MICFLCKEAQSGSIQEVCDLPLEATGGPWTPTHPTTLCVHVPMFSSTPPTAYLPVPSQGKDTSVNLLALFQFLTAVKPLNGKKTIIS